MATHYTSFPITTKLGQMIKDVGHGIAIASRRWKTCRPMVAVPRHSNVTPYRFAIPAVTDATFIAPNAHVLGNVGFGHGTSIMYGSSIKNMNLNAGTYVGDHTTILERVSIMGTTRIGDNCVVGIGASLDSCIIKNNVFIGHGAVISYGCVVEEGAIIAAGSVLPMDTRVGAGELWAGNMAEKIDMVTAHQADEVQHIVHHLHDDAAAHDSSIKALYAKNENLDLEWLKTVQSEVETQQTAVAIKEAAEIPVEARRFVQTRVQARRREQTLRASTNSSAIAPWFSRGIANNKGNI